MKTSRLAKDWVIDFYRLPVGQTRLEAVLDNAFFQERGYEEFISVQVVARFEIQKKDQFFVLVTVQLEASGTVPCDYCLQPLTLVLSGNETTSIYWEESVKEFDDSALGHWRVPIQQDEVDCGQWLYELVVAAVPIRRSHEGCATKMVSGE